MIDYPALKSLHVGCALATGIGFVLRGLVALRDPALLRGSRTLRALPHAVDTLLLASALGMVWHLGAGAWSFGWIQAKLGLLLGYIACGHAALSPRNHRATRAGALLLATLLLAAILVTAITKQPLGLGGA